MTGVYPATRLVKRHTPTGDQINLLTVPQYDRRFVVEQLIMNRVRLLIACVFSALILWGSASGSAFAADPTPSNANYGDVDGNRALGDTTHAAGTAGTLPFTGADLMVYVAVGLGLAGTGFALRRSAAPKP
jgi:hypothetical protein